MKFPERLLFGVGVVGAAVFLCAFGYALFVGVDGSDESLTLKTPTAAMEPTILTGDYFTAQKLSRGSRPVDATAIARGDLVVHDFPPDPTKRFVKRIVGLPGDTLAMHRGVLLVDGRAPAEPYAWHSDPVDSGGTSAEDLAWQRDYLVDAAAAASYRPSRNEWGPIVVPPGEYFVLGDNRDNSLDSRYWGFVDRAQLVARPRRVYFSLDPATRRIRWSRFGHLLR